MFYLLTSNKPTRQNKSYTVGNDLIKKVDFILSSYKKVDDIYNNSNIINNNIDNDTIIKIK
jgi:hypothetical protein